MPAVRRNHRRIGRDDRHDSPARTQDASVRLPGPRAPRRSVPEDRRRERSGILRRSGLRHATRPIGAWCAGAPTALIPGLRGVHSPAGKPPRTTAPILAGSGPTSPNPDGPIWRGFGDSLPPERRAVDELTRRVVCPALTQLQCEVSMHRRFMAALAALSLLASLLIVSPIAVAAGGSGTARQIPFAAGPDP